MEARLESPERRRLPRVQVDLPAMLWEDVGWHRVQVTDLSYGGVGIVAFRAPKLGQRVKLTLDLFPERDLTVEVEVVREARFPRSFGLRLCEPSEGTLTALAGCMQRRALAPPAHERVFSTFE
jgi:hypothetical protein